MNSPSSRPRLPESTAALWSALIAAALAGLMMIPLSDFALDDAYIHLCYAKSLRLGDGPSYNPGDWETGSSSPLWVALLSLWPFPTGGDASPVRAVQLLGLLFHTVTAAAGAELTLELLRRRASLSHPIPLRSLTWLSGGLVASTPTVLQAAVSGMEVPLATALIGALAWAVVKGHPGGAAILALLATLARPEAAVFALVLGTLLLLSRRRAGPSSWWVPGAAALGAVVGLVLWISYDLAVSGYPWPNTQYIKGRGGGLAGLAYLQAEVLPWQTWLVSLSGVVLLARAMWVEVSAQRYEAPAILVATVATWLVIATTRPLHPGIQFFESRYFVIVAALPSALLPLGLPGLRRWLSALLVVPVAVVSGLVCRELADVAEELARDTHAVHTRVGRYLATALPPDAVLGVEGAGATRFFTPRTMHVFDLVGLNDGTAAHLHHDRRAKTCYFLERAPTHLVIPAHWVPTFGSVFRLEPLTHFDDPHYTQTLPPRPHRVSVFSVVGPRSEWERRCAEPAVAGPEVSVDAPGRAAPSSGRR